MGEKRYLHLVTLFLVFLLLPALFNVSVYASNGVAGENRYYLGSLVNAGKDTGYSEENDINEDDPHFGWKLGDFHISGYTRITDEDTNSPVFLKNVGDTVTLWFLLRQNIDSLNNKDNLYVNDDINGFDKNFGIEKTDFGRGTLIIRHTDYQNNSEAPVIYTDYLTGKITPDKDFEVELFEEGDYEVALNYEIAETKLDILGWKPLPKYRNYRIFFKFSVRNGNTMVFPHDVITRTELTNTSITENGFYLDFANTKYLDIDIKKEILKEGADGLIEDVRFNRPAKDGEVYKEEGIYTITATNNYTNQKTTKVIYVGTNNILKAVVTTGFSVNEIMQQIDNGAQVTEDGTIIHLGAESSEPGPNESNTDAETQSSTDPGIKFIVVVSISVILVLAFLFVRKKRRLQNMEVGREGKGGSL
jgi:hypothetical protein